MAGEAETGLSRGLMVGLENVRDRRYKEAQQALALKQGDLRTRTEQLGLESAQRRADWEQQDRPGNVDELQYERNRRRKTDTQTDTLFNEQQDDLAHQRERRGTLEGQHDRAAASEQAARDQEFALKQRQLQQEGLGDFVKALRSGADPNYALQRFNRQGQLKIKPESFQFDPRTGSLKFEDSNGGKFDANLDALAIFAGQTPAFEKISDTDRIVRRNPDNSFTDVTPAEVPGTTRPRGGAKVSTYNPQTEQGAIEKSIKEQFKGISDPFGNFSVDDADKAKAATMVARGTEMEGRLREQLMNGQITRGQLVDVVRDAWMDMPNDDELDKKAAKIGGTKEQQAQWRDTEKRRLVAQAEAKQAAGEAKMLKGAVERGADQEAATLPEAARSHLKEGETTEFRNGQVWTLENGKPKRVK